MIEFSTCYSCRSAPGAQCGRDIDTFSNLSSARGDGESIVKVNMGHGRCFGSQVSLLRSGRSIKSSCLLTVVMAFIVGVVIGLLIPYYLVPVTVETLSYHHVPTAYTSKGYEHLALTPQPPVIFSAAGAVSNNIRNSYSLDTVVNESESNVVYNNNVNRLSEEFPTTDESVSNRFPEFAQIQALRGGSEAKSDLLLLPPLSLKPAAKRADGGKPLPLVPIPVRRRPPSNIKFVAPDSRILSLHPVQAEIPSPDFKDNGVKIRDSDRINGIYWSDAVEASLPMGFSDRDVANWRNFAEAANVTKIEEGCGRMQNRLLSLENTTKACCRYRHNFDQIQGEIFSFYLSQVLGIRNLAPSALNVIQPEEKRWTSVRQELNVAQWETEKPVVLTRFIDNLSQAYIPPPFRDASRRLHPIDLALSANLVESLDIKELAQWSDLIVFDYLTANLDRMVNNLYNLQWNPQMMEFPAHNLAKDKETGLLVFLDNESGLLHGYRLLDKYEQYHRVMLESLCVFRRSTADAIKRLRRDKNVGHLLKTMFSSLEPNINMYLPMIPDKSIKILNHRIDKVYQQISKCESLYS